MQALFAKMPPEHHPEASPTVAAADSALSAVIAEVFIPCFETDLSSAVEALRHALRSGGP